MVVKELLIPALARESHDGDSGTGCVMNLMCWFKGMPNDVIDDDPQEWFQTFRELLIVANDNMCHHLHHGRDKNGNEVELNCPSCSDFLLQVGFTLADSSWLMASGVEDWNVGLLNFDYVAGREATLFQDQVTLTKLEANQLHKKIVKAHERYKLLRGKDVEYFSHSILCDELVCDPEGEEFEYHHSFLVGQDLKKADAALDKFKEAVWEIADLYEQLRVRHEQNKPVFKYLLKDAVKTGHITLSAAAPLPLSHDK